MTRRTIVIASTSVMVLLLTAAGVWWAQQPDDKPKTAACPYPKVPETLSLAVPDRYDRTRIAAPSGGAVTVIDTGFTQTENDSAVSIGAVLENTSSRVAYRTRAFFRAHAADGDYALDDPALFHYHFEIPIIRPGERAVVGTYASLNSTNFRRTGIWLQVARAHLDLFRTQWIPETDTGTFPAISAQPDPTQPPLAEDDLVTVRLAANSNACRALGGRGMSMVFRNAAGAVVGGAFDGTREADFCAAGDFSPRALVFGSRLPDADLARTEVNVYCDVAPSSGLPPGPFQPVN
ncbi:hypothetical protein O7626_39160 [Micromonospora sp. WMMD1102]|uniref:hypothetical protein n=1 Tax=Micromonospora sp. WMMD1102 TaxID=3016105 RepID=UPI0024153762|nr:hypothetical protein [Micromonospora sp. WMMD1102]MDG4791836.1 hypothetical protein [Micromonospora sp. WMMD1102]